MCCWAELLETLSDTAGKCLSKLMVKRYIIILMVIKTGCSKDTSSNFDKRVDVRPAVVESGQNNFAE
jgi:hypothetical protein